MQKVTINGQNFLGCVSTSKTNEVTLSKALEVMNLGDVQESTFGEYLKAQNAKTLRKMSMSGLGVSTTCEDLTDEESLRFDIVKSKMKLAKAGAMASLENTQFDNLMGK